MRAERHKERNSKTRKREGGEMGKPRCRIVKRKEEEEKTVRDIERGETERDIGRKARSKRHRKRIKCSERIKRLKQRGGGGGNAGE